MIWKIEFSNTAKKTLAKLDKQIARRILLLLQKRVASLKDPRTVGEALKGSVLGNYWRYRVGDYRLICDIHDTKIMITVLQIGHRREIYR